MRILVGNKPSHLYRQREATSLPLRKAILPQKRCSRQGDSSATRTLLLQSRQREEIIAFLPSQAILLVKSQHKQDDTTLFKASLSGRGMPSQGPGVQAAPRTIALMREKATSRRSRWCIRQ